MYAGDNEGRLVPNGDWDAIGWIDSPDIPGFALNWVGGTLHWDSWPDSTNLHYLVSPPFGRLGSYLGGATRPFKCPADRFLSEEQRALGWVQRVRSISMNVYMGDGIFGGGGIKGYALNPKERFYLRLSDMSRKRSPSDLFVFLDEHPDSVHGPSYPGAYGPDILDWRVLVGSQHYRRCTFSFVDGHTEVKKWLSPETSQPVVQRLLARVVFDPEAPGVRQTGFALGDAAENRALARGRAARLVRR